ncbi:tryptophan synthase subunit beta, partial [Clavibacter michiganensis subsp. michiganensis]|nr:tryptophan synthase subunit beta [Clavibacter michiganensis subsp. michiganensis]
MKRPEGFDRPRVPKPPAPAAPGPYFGDFGGRYVPESLVAALDELAEAWEELKV